MLSIGTTVKVRRPDGSPFEESGYMQYLGGLLSGDGRVDSELSRKLGAAKGDFAILKRLWSHAGVSRAQKLHFFNAFIISKLLYGLSSIWMVTAQKRRLDGFQAKCLHQIMGVPPSFLS